MTQEEQMVNQGTAAETVLSSTAFNQVVNNLVEQSFQAYVTSDPDDDKGRTAVYYQYRALREIIDTLKQCVAVRDEITNRNESETRSKEEEQTMSFDNVNDSSKSNEAADLNVDDAAEAILGNWEDPEEVSEENQEATEETTAETEVDESVETEDDTEEYESEEDDEDPVNEEDETEEDEDQDEDSEESVEEEDEQQEEELVLEDDTLVEISVDGEVKQASVKDLKRLYGQEASLTRKSQEVASQRKEAEESLQKADASLQAMLHRAQERFKPYQDVDMLVASKQMSAEDFTALRAESKQAEDDYKFLTEEADNFYGYVQERQKTAKAEEAKECLQVLQREVPDWNNGLYNDIRQYAISQGLPEESVNQYADPNVIMLLNKARMFDQTKKVATVKKAKAAKKVLRSKKAPPTKAAVKKREQQKKIEAMQANGNDLDVIADALMSNWQ